MLSKNILLNLGLLLIVAVLAAVIWNTKETSSDLPLLSNYSQTDIDSIIISHKDNMTSILRVDDSWSIHQPVSVPANNFRVKSILKLLHAPVHSEYPVASINLAQIGITEQSTSIHFNQYRFRFGDTNPATGLRYLEHNDTIYTIEDVYFPLLSSHFSTLVSLNLIPDNFDLEAINTPYFDLSRSTKSGTQQINTASDIFLHWKKAQAFGIHHYLEREQLGEVMISSTDNKSIRYLITDTDPWLILARPELGIEYHIEQTMMSQLLKLDPSSDD